jgi:DNA-binding transcriptional ArsR family regulator
MSQFQAKGSSWLFLTNHTHVLLQIARSPDSSSRAIAAAVGITMRQTQRIVADLTDAGYIDKQRRGRTNHYRVHSDAHLRHPQLAEHAIGGVLEALGAAPPPPGSQHWDS